MGLATRELREKKILLLRIHTNGEVYSAGYARKWLEIMKQNPGVRMWLYSRAWVDKGVRAVLKEMDGLRNVRVWWSLDRDMPVPRKVPRRTRLAYLQVDPGEKIPEEVSLVFRIRKLRKGKRGRVQGKVICPTETGLDRAEQMSCSSCQICFSRLPEDREPGVRTGRLSLKLVSDG